MKSRQWIGALDQGTTSTRFIVFDQDGVPRGRHQLEHRQSYPRGGWVEHDPLEIWQKACECIRGALADAGATGADLAAIGITNQRETVVAWDPRSGQPLHPAIVWQDGRGDELCRRLARDCPAAEAAGLPPGQDRFRDLSGLPLAGYFSASKIAWLLDNVKGLRRQAERGRALCGTIDSWLVWWLTGGPDGGRHATDLTNASRTLLMDLAGGDWSPLLLEAFGVPRAMLPAIRASSDAEAFGLTRADGPVGAAVPIAAVLGDQQAALFGQACFQRGEAKNTYGTGCFLLMNTGERIVRSNHGLVSTVAYRLANRPPVYALEGSVAVAGSLVQWARDQLGIIGSSAEIDALAATVPDSAGVYVVPAFAGLFAPYWRSDARGLIIGLTHYAGRAHLARAILEATAFQSRELFDAMVTDSGIELRSLKVDGGMVASEVLMQFQANILGAPVRAPRHLADVTCLGAASAAGLAVGLWRDLDHLAQLPRHGRSWEPRLAEGPRAERYAQWKKAVQRSLDWAT